ncbi:MAG: dTMP kinase [Mycoplasmataceae bacterium]|jgi:dTMP kinase|nr:dTMP kinase [Mycoplasmataceae bacterium]
MNKRGLFITFEGPDGSGKSTIISMVYEKLNQQHFPFKILLTREPGGKNNIVAEDIRNLLLNKTEYNINYRTEALLFAASRAQHVHDFIKPHLLNGDLVLCDRYVHSSLVYQGYARGIGFKNIWDINTFAIDNVLPDLVIVLMINPQQGINRIKGDLLRDNNRLDREEMDLHNKVYEGYRQLIDNNRNGTIVQVEASKKIDEVFDDVFQNIIKKINKHYVIK